ncbi:hypothetical protein TWF694_010867 [Orbilia ellipsospora]|uniref:Terpene synthase n=1 Tax=Orbilia ellipsospora TaxID=2528407 RepID=A0AAV9X9W6_9PEZI
MAQRLEQLLSNFGFDPDNVSTLLDPTVHLTAGFAREFPLRVSKFEKQSDEGVDEARSDWATYVGTFEKWGTRDPNLGNGIALVTPLCRPDRIKTLGYICEWAFCHDEIMDSSPDHLVDINHENPRANENGTLTADHIANIKQLRAKFYLEVLTTDPDAAKSFIVAWEQMIQTTTKHVNESREFTTMDEYMEYRKVDVGSWLSTTLACYGMGIKLTTDELKSLAEIEDAWGNSYVIINDYFSFDKEHDELLQSRGTKLSNCILLYMKWEKLDVEAAKAAAKKQNQYWEQKFSKLVGEYLDNRTGHNPDVLRYLLALCYMLSGAAAWSAVCPRYNERLTPGSYQFSMPARPEPGGADTRFEGEEVSENDTNSSIPSSRSSDTSASVEAPSRKSLLGFQHLLAPYEYTIAVPSKGIRETFVDAINLWFGIPVETISSIKNIAKVLHTASLLLDDVEDNSPLRRGQDAAHIIYGEAQTVNSANYLIIWAMSEINKLGNPACLGAFFGQ